jgi:hypothetical protein
MVCQDRQNEQPVARESDRQTLERLYRRDRGEFKKVAMTTEQLFENNGLSYQNFTQFFFFFFFEIVALTNALPTSE